MQKQKHISLAIQDPYFIVSSVLQRTPYLGNVNIGLVKRVEKEYTWENKVGIIRSGENSKYIRQISKHEKPTGKYAFFNENIEEYLKKDEIIDYLSVKIVSDGYDYFIGGNILSKPILTPKDLMKLPKDFPMTGSELDNFKLNYQYKSCEHDWQQRILGLNTDLEGNLMCYVEKDLKAEKGLFKRFKKTKKVKELQLNPFPDNEKEASELILKDLVKICKLLENGVNGLASYHRELIEPIGEIHLSMFHNKYGSKILFDNDSEESLAIGYETKEIDGIKIDCHKTKNQIIYERIKELNIMYDLKTDEVKDTIRESVSEVITKQIAEGDLGEINLIGSKNDLN